MDFCIYLVAVLFLTFFFSFFVCLCEYMADGSEKKKGKEGSIFYGVRHTHFSLFVSLPKLFIQVLSAGKAEANISISIHTDRLI